MLEIRMRILSSELCFSYFPILFDWFFRLSTSFVHRIPSAFTDGQEKENDADYLCRISNYVD